ncbi:helix-turn-helix domain-containing protein [Methylobacterium oxalidis]|uniref:helix-turn-helix domain-containing protein n=1 Tax=Methylobacterium oxalidis TaxID=944322 RepID=UPI00331562FA
MERGKESLAGTTQPIAEIALACGFASQNGFTTAFKRVTGTTPHSWRIGQS